VMDDASADATPQIVAAYGDRVRSYRQPHNRGIYGNINDGIARARGGYVAIYHADDIYHPRIVEQEAAFLERHPGVGAVFCQSLFIDPTGLAYARRESPPEVCGGRPLAFDEIVNALLMHMNRFLRCPSVMIRSAVLRDVGAFRDREWSGSADLDMWLRIAHHSGLGVIEEYLLAYRLGHDNAAERVHRLRTQPRRYFEIMNRCLATGVSASAVARRAFESHRARDTLVRAINHYVRGQRRAARVLLRDVRLGRVASHASLPRRNWCVWLAVMHLLTRLPPSTIAARWVQHRWGSGTMPSPRGRRRFALPTSGENWNQVAAALPPL